LEKRTKNQIYCDGKKNVEKDVGENTSRKFWCGFVFFWHIKNPFFL